MVNRTSAVTCYLDVLDRRGAVAQEIPIAGTVKVGRASPQSHPDVVIPGECLSASRLHAVIETGPKGVVLTDRSSFGSIVNGKLIHGRSLELHNGDEVIFGKSHDGWHVRFRSPHSDDGTTPADPLELLTVSESPRQVRVGRSVIEEHLGDRAFQLLIFLASHKGEWYPVSHLEELLWPDPDRSPYQAQQSLSRSKRAVNDLLRPYLNGQDAIKSWPNRGYCIRTRLDKD